MSESSGRPEAADRFAVSPGARFFGYVCHEFPGMWTRLEALETACIEDQLRNIPIEKPIYVTGLARSGTTILLELLAELPSVATHRYRDFPPIWVPYAWNRFLELVPNRPAEPRERPHGDGIRITPESPEAMEEAIWMRFFPRSHDPRVSNLLERTAGNDAFGEFYRRHIRKLLLVRGGRRYVAKGNYNVARLGYLHELFPDARFVIPVRHPVSHVASLMRQHRTFTEGQRAHPAARAYLRRVGHFEFGMDRAPINMGDAQAMRQILACWQTGDEAGGWAAYWSHVYGTLLDQLDADGRLREAVQIVRHEDLNARPTESLSRVFEHCGLDVETAKIAKMANRLRQREYDRKELSQADERRILQATEATMARYGYATGGD